MADNKPYFANTQPSSRQVRRWGLLFVVALALIGLSLAVWAGREFIKRTHTDIRQSLALSAIDRLSVEQNRAVETAEGPIAGERRPAVVIVEFSDFACAECHSTAQVAREIASEYGTSVQLQYRDFVEQTDANALRLAETGKCAHEQDRFWIFYDRFLLHPETNDAEEVLTLIKNIGLDMQVFRECLASHKYAAAVNDDYQAGRSAKVRGAPTLFFNGYRIEGSLSKQDFYDILDLFIPDLNPGNIESSDTNSPIMN